MQKKTELISTPLEHNVFSLIKGEPQRVYLLLHGYLLDGEYILNKLEKAIPDHSLILAPNGLFPVPVKKKDYYIPKYAWYFFDSTIKKYYVDFGPGVHYIKSLLEIYNQKNLPLTVIGYSQGGYISAKVGEEIELVDRVIGLACTFRNERFSYRKGLSYSQIHGDCDVIVDPKESKREFDILKEKGNQGEFHLLESVTHRIDDTMVSKLEQLLQ